MTNKSTTGRFYYYKAQADWIARLLRRLTNRPTNDNFQLDIQITEAELGADLNYGRR